MKEVSCRVFDVFFRDLRKKHLPPHLLAEGTPYSVEYLRNRHERVEWQHFLQIIRNARTIWSEEDFVDLGGRGLRAPLVRMGVIVARLSLSVRQLYFWVLAGDGGLANQYFSSIHSTVEDKADGFLVAEWRFRDEYEPSRELLLFNKGGLIEMPTLLGKSRAHVEMTEIERGARYEVHYPTGGGVLSWLRRAVAWPFTVRAAARELKEAHETLRTRYDELEGARNVLSLQARQLQTAHRISQLIHGDLDLDRTLKAVATALVEVGGFVAAEVNLLADVDGGQLDLRASAGQPPAGVSATCDELLSRGRPIGNVMWWPAAGASATERSALLEFILPTISLALDNAMTYRTLTEYRETLELKVAERTAQLVQARDDLARTVTHLEEAQAARDRIFANLNHEIRTPLALVNLTVAELKLFFGERPSGTALHQLTTIEMNVRKLLRLVDELLLLAAGREGKLQLRVTNCDLAQLLDLVVASWRLAAEAEGLTLTYHGPRRCVRQVDQDKLERIITNLISNAIKFTPAGGAVQVELVDTVEATVISVRDTGIGIDDDLRKRLFGRFEQGRPALHTTRRGSGIGLSLVKELTEAHGGHISAESPRGGGSIFRVTLPADARVAEHAEVINALEMKGDGLALLPHDFGLRESPTPPRVLDADGRSDATVLVAEDDAALATAIGELLRRHYRVLLAPDGMTALRLAQEHMPDLLVSDIGMPGMDGLELTRRFRELPGNRLAPVLLLTAYANLPDRISGFDAGAIDYVVKPFEPAELLARIRSQLALRAVALKLHQSEKLAALGTLSAGLAHEMRNPANAIINAIEPLCELLPAPMLDEAHPVSQLIGVLQECANQIAILSRQLLGFRRPGELDRQETYFCHVLARALALTQPLLRGIELREDLQYDGTFLCAAPLLTQVLANLLENAAHAAGSGGWVRVTSRRERDRLILEIGDSGPGVPRELRERIFEPFFTTKPPGAGTGLGLTTSRQIIERHDGHIEVRDAPDGSLFHIELPLEQRSAVELGEWRAGSVR